MARSRLLIVSIITGACLVGVPIPTHAGQRIPDTLERAFELSHGLTLRATNTTGVYAFRGVRKLPIRGNLIAFSFRTAPKDESRAAGAVAFEARFHTQQGWGAWDEIPIDEDGPDAGSIDARRAVDRVFAGPTWVGTSDYMMVRVVANAGAPVVSDIRVHVINSLGDARVPDVFHRVVNAISRFMHGSEAEAMPATPRIITRHGWGANEDWREKDCCPRYASSVKMAFIHHTAGTNSYSRSQSAAIVRGIYRFHTKTRHWSDIGYNFLVDRYGQIFEGRYGGMDRPVVGAHVKAFNRYSTGISLMGNFVSAHPTSAMISALKRLLAWKLDIHHIPAVGTVYMTAAGGDPKFHEGRRYRMNRISGHRDGQQTSCPGINVYRLLPSIRRSVRAIGYPKIYLPSLSNSLLRPDGDTKNETSTVRATFDRSVHWTVAFRTNAGTLLKTFTGTGTSEAVTWNGKDSGGALADTGVVRYTINARYGSRIARAVTGSIYMVNKHPDGTVLRSTTRTVVVEAGKARPVPTALVANSWYRPAEVVAATNAEIDRYAVGDPVSIREGTLLVEPDGTYSIISGGERRPFATGVYAALGYPAAAALPIDATQLAGLSSGPQINDATQQATACARRTARR
ncbi:MAG: hypothetical protein E6G68_07515 [Actinobacteria bacterium]|nr:MAG: hypothetical protein E6G68_07515 [Actinomycetota bacterium]